MARILILHTGLQGITNANLEIVRRLSDSGHYVISSTQIDRSQAYADHGFEYIKLNQLWFGSGKPFVGKFKNRLFTSLFKRKSFLSHIYNNLQLDQLDSLITKEKIDLILIDVELHEYVIHLTNKNVPLILISQWFAFWETGRNLPLSSKLIPNINNKPGQIWSHAKRKGKVKSLIKYFKNLGLTRKSLISFVADKEGMSIGKYRSYCFPSLYAFTQYPVISLTHPDLEFGPLAFDKLYYSYPMVNEKRIEFISEDFKNKYDYIMNQKENRDIKLIVVTYSSMKEQEDVVSKNLISTLSKLKNCISIVSIKSNVDSLPKDLDNIFFFNNIPQIKALASADLSINHGGIHTLNECIHFAVPVLVISGEKFDQNGCSARIKNHECGLVLEKESSEEQLSHSIDLLLNNESYKNKIKALNKTYMSNKLEKKFEKWVAKHLD